MLSMGKSSTARNGKLVLVPGVRLNYDPTADAGAIDASGNAVGVSTAIKVVFDPSNTAAPYLIADLSAEAPLPTATQLGFQNFETAIDRPNDEMIKYNAANGTDYLAISGVNGSLLTTTEMKSIKGGNLSWMTSMWWNLSGNFGLGRTADNNYMRYYVPGTVGTQVDMKANGSSPVLDLAPLNFSRNVSDTKVAVLTFDLATETGRFVDATELLGGTLFLCDDKSASAITGVVLPIDCGFASYSGV